MAGTLFVVATPIGNLEDISARALRVLREVNLIAAEDTRRTAHLLARYGIATPATSLHEHNEDKKAGALVRRLLSGESIALVSDAGTPAVSDPGAELVRAAAADGIRVEPIPGPSAVIAAISATGLPSVGFQFIGFAPKKSGERRDWLERMRQTDLASVFFESPHRIKFTLEDLQRTLGDREVLIARELTKLHEQLVRGPISTVLAAIADPIGEYTVVVFPPTGEARGEQISSETITSASLYAEFSASTRNSAMTRRQAIAALSRKYRLPAGEVYEKLEQGKRSGG